MEGVTIVDHPLVQHKLTLIRGKNLSTKSFRELLKEIGTLLCYEVTRDLPLTKVEIETPLARMMSPRIAGKKLVFAPILRAGTTFAEGMLDLVPAARVAHIGLYRDPHTLVPIEYYLKLPDDVQERLVIVVDPMVATGHSAIAAITRLRQAGVAQMSFACLIAAPEGLAALANSHPWLPVYVAAVDRQLDDHGYIRPGLGEAGDRLYGTR